VVVEELGRRLAATPWLSTVALAGAALAEGDNAALQQKWLPAICAGEAILAFAHEEGPRHRREIAAHARDGRLYGTKLAVLDAELAGGFVVSAADGLYFVEKLPITDHLLVDGRHAATVTLDGAPGVRIGGTALLDRVLDRAQILLAAEMLGALQEVFEKTLAYLKTRKQFGVPIGSFQALKHRAAWIHCETELLRAVVGEALDALAAGREDVPILACCAKARACDALLLGAAEAIQMHGGIGVTEELDIGLYYKKARVAEMLLGDAAHQRDRFAQLRGY
jgi:alkylation response protein AidB-like acyl-CoA dehydrogenase